MLADHLEGPRGDAPPVVEGDRRAAGDDEVADAGGVALGHGSEPAGLDDLVSLPHPGAGAEERPPGGDRVLPLGAGGLRRPVQLDEPGLAGGEGHMLEELGVLGVVDPLGGSDVDHPVVGGDEQERVRGGLARQALEREVAFVPGTEFVVDEALGKASLRFSFASNPTEVMQRRVARIAELFAAQC